MSNSVWPHRRQPTRLPRPWDSPGKNTGVGCHFLLQCMKVKSKIEASQSCQTLCNPIDCSPPGSSIHGIFQARVLEWSAIAFSGYVDDTTLMAESGKELKNILMKVKEESDKAGLKLSIQKTKIMASGPIISWQVGGETMETVTDFISLGSKITMDGDCRHEIKRCFLLGKKAMTNLDDILKSRDITMVCIVKAMVFPVVIYGCESWAMKKAEHQRIDAFKLRC